MLMVLSAWDYRYFMPAFEVTVDQVNQRFGDQFQLQLLPLMQPETNDCSRATADMSNLISKYYYENKSTTALSFVAVSTCKVIFIIITSLRFIVTNGPSKIYQIDTFAFFGFSSVRRNHATNCTTVFRYVDDGAVTSVEQILHTLLEKEVHLSYKNE